MADIMSVERIGILNFGLLCLVMGVLAMIPRLIPPRSDFKHWGNGELSNPLIGYHSPNGSFFEVHTSRASC